MEHRLAHWFWRGVKEGLIKIDDQTFKHVGSLRWKNTMEWLEAYWKRTLPMDFSDVVYDSHGGEHLVAVRAFEIVKEPGGLERVR